jgi:DNA-binding transcriptional MerR regulator
VILPFIVRMLGREIRDLQSVLSAPPDALRNPASKRTEKREQLRRDRDRLSAQIERAEENLLLSPDSRTFKRLDARLSAMRDQLETLEADLASEEPQSNGYTREELTALAEWWENFDKTAVSVPVDDVPMEAHLHIDPYAEESCVLIDARKVNEALFQLGCEVRLWWETHKSTWSMAASQKKADKLRNRKRAFKQRDHHVLAKGRFRLGQHEGRIPQSVLEPLATRDTTTGR